LPPAIASGHKPFTTLPPILAAGSAGQHVVAPVAVGQAELHAGREVIDVLAQHVAVQFVQLDPTRRLAEFVAGDGEQGVALGYRVGPAPAEAFSSS